MTQETTILQFPKDKIIREHIPEDEDLLRQREVNKKKFADSLIEDLSEEILYALSDVGIDVEEVGFSKDFHFFVGTLTATIYRAVKIEHELHNFIDENVKIIPFGEPIPKMTEEEDAQQ